MKDVPAVNRKLRCAVYIEIYVAPTWDTGDSWRATMQHIAKEAGCWVIGTATALQGNDLPADFPDRDTLFKPDEWINDGGAIVVKPMGAIAAGPLNREKGILYAKSTRKLPGEPADRLMFAATIQGRISFRSPSTGNRYTPLSFRIDMM